MKRICLILSLSLVAAAVLFAGIRDRNIDNDARIDPDKIDCSKGTFTNPTISGGNADGITIGGTTPAAGTFTTLRATGLVTTDTGLKVGSSGTQITQILMTMKTVNCDEVAAQSSIDFTVTLNGVGPYDAVFACPLGALNDGLTCCAIGGGTNLVTVRITNATAGGIDPPAMNYAVFAVRRQD